MANNDWYARHLGLQSPAPTSLPPTIPPQNPTYIPTTQHGVPVSYDPARDQMVSKAQSSRLDDRCPGCYSGNYFAPTGTQLKRCYDCGYPLVQAGTGTGMPSGSGGSTSTPAKQVGQGGGFNPNIIVDRIG